MLQNKEHITQSTHRPEAISLMKFAFNAYARPDGIVGSGEGSLSAERLARATWLHGYMAERKDDRRPWRGARTARGRFWASVSIDKLNRSAASKSRVRNDIDKEIDRPEHGEHDPQVPFLSLDRDFSICAYVSCDNVTNAIARVPHYEDQQAGP